jgi:bifunctional non-homologous end joining protein LigD
VGTGFDDATLASLYRQLVPLKTASSPLAMAIPERNVTLVRPRLVAQISYQELTGDGKLRQPVFLGLRSDKSAGDVVLPK